MADGKEADGVNVADLFPEVVPTAPPVVDNDERFTLPGTLEWCRAVAGVECFDLDVAGCAESHCAERFYDKTQNGLILPWRGRVWCNCPWSNVPAWIIRAGNAMASGECELVAQLLPGNRTEQPWWQQCVEPERDGRGTGSVRLTTHFLPGRTQYGSPGDPLGLNAGSPNFTSVLLVWRRTDAPKKKRRLRIIDVPEETK